MAGRKKARPRDEQRGASPLRGKVPAAPPPPGGRAAPPLQGVVRGPVPPPGDDEPGLERGTHMAGSREGSKHIRAAAAAMEAAFLADPDMPDHFRSPAFRGELRDMCRASALGDWVWNWLCLAEEEGGLMALFLPPMPGTRPPVEVMLSVLSKAANHRSRMGANPVSYARIAKDLGLTARTAEDGLARLAAEGAEIVSRRGELEAGPGDGEWPG